MRFGQSKLKLACKIKKMLFFNEQSPITLKRHMEKDSNLKSSLPLSLLRFCKIL